MANELPADYLIDRRRLRRKLSFWRIAAFAVFVIALGAAAYRWTDGLSVVASRHHIARLTLSGVLTGDRDTLKLIDDIGKSQASAVIVSIESPGGTTTGAERIYDELRRLSAKKPVVAVVGTMAASGGYIAALGTDRIFARGNSLVGSIGVLFQYPNFGKVMETVGVKMEEVNSSPLKASPNGFEPTSPEARAALAALVSDSFDWFKSLVKERRQLSDSQLAAVADGRVFTARQGLPLKLIDEVGGQREAIAWLEKEKNVAKDLPVRDWRTTRSSGYLSLLGMSANLVEAAGVPALAGLLRRIDTGRDGQMLDGLMAIWHVPDMR
jgi:protease-4